MLDVLDSSGMIATLVTGILPAPAWLYKGQPSGWGDGVVQHRWGYLQGVSWRPSLLR